MYNPQLDIFLAVVATGSFTKASEQLYMSSTAIMNQINALEKHLGFKLFERSARGVNLTEAGKSIAVDAKKIIRSSNAAIHRAKQKLSSNQHVIRIGTSLLNPCKPLIDLLKNASNDVSSFSIKIVPIRDDFKRMLFSPDEVAEKIDFIVTPCDSAALLKEFHFFPLGEYKICCAMPRSHNLANKKLLTVADLINQTVMMIAPGDSVIIDEIRNLLLSSGVNIESTDIFYVAEDFNRCEQENAILITLDGWAEVHPSLVTIPVDWTFTMPLGLLYHKQPSESCIKFLEFIRRIK